MFTTELYLCCNMEAIFQELGRRGDKDILRKTKTDIFTTKRPSLRETAKALLHAEGNNLRIKNKY